MSWSELELVCRGHTSGTTPEALSRAQRRQLFTFCADCSNNASRTTMINIALVAAGLTGAFLIGREYRHRVGAD